MNIGENDQALENKISTPYMWNSLDLKCPSSDVSEYQPQDRYLIENLRDFPTVLTTAADTLTSDHPLWEEMFVLRNIQAKYKRILHCDKCLLYLQRVGHCLKKMVLLNLSKNYTDLADRFLIGLKKTYIFNLPSRQQVEYVLIRTQASAKLVCEAIRYSQDTFCFLIQKLKVGHSSLELVMATSVTARLNVLLKTVLLQLCDMYQKIFSWCYKVKQGEHKWPEKLYLPADLEKWIMASESELMKPLDLISKEDAEFLSSLIKINGKPTDDTDSVIELDVEHDSDCYVVDDTDKADYGEVIPRKNSSKKRAPRLSKTQKLFLRRIICAQTLEKLEDIWNSIHDVSQDHLPKTLTAKNKRIISTFFTRLTERHQEEAKKRVKRTPSVSVIGMNFAKYLGFTPNQINACKSNPTPTRVSPTADMKLQPVKTLKELKTLYKQLCGMLQFSDQVEKHKKLKKMYKRRLTDIKLLKESGEKVFVRKLIFCTSKVLLTICQK